VGYSQPNIGTREVKATILNHPEFTAYAKQVAGIFAGWRKAHEAGLKGLKVNDIPKQIIHRLSEDLLARYTDVPLLSRYAVYQRLMDYWAETMQDDVYLIAADGWREAAKPRGIIEDKEKKIKETPDLTLGRKKYKMDLIPPALIVARYYAKEQATLDALQEEMDAATRVLEEYIEEHSGEEGLLSDATNDKGKVTKAAVKARLVEINAVIPAKAGIQDDQEELDALEHCLKLIEAEADASKAVKDAQAALDEKVLAHYAKLSEAEIKNLVVEDKWLAAIQGAIEGEVQRLTQQLAARVKELEERYAKPLPHLEREVEDFSTKVEEHLKKMGFAWA
jgi:type I restriction enzyme M protein